MLNTIKQNIGKQLSIKLNWGSPDFIGVKVIQPLEEDYESYLCEVTQSQGNFKKGSLIEVSQSNLIDVKQ